MPPVSTLGAQVIGQGSITIGDHSAHYDISVHARKDGSITGHVRYEEEACKEREELDMKSASITAVVVSGRHARIFGNGTIKRSSTPIAFVADVEDTAAASDPDRFGIQLSTGYSAGPSPVKGFVNIK